MGRFRHRFWLLLLLLPLLLAAGELRVLVTADLHGNMEGLCRLAVPIRQIRPPRVAIDLGDLVQSGWIADRLDGIPMADLLNQQHYDLFLPGNHDFELGGAALGRMLKRFQGKVLGADWDWPGVCTPVKWVLIRRGGVSVAFIGLAEPRQYQRMLPCDGASFLPAAAALAAVEREVFAASPDVVILACHRGRFSASGRLADLTGRFPWIDVVLGAHTHETVPGARLGRAFFVQPGHHAATAAELTLLTDEAGKMPPRITSRLLRPAPEVPADPECAAIVSAAQTEVQKQVSGKRYRLTLPPGEALAKALLNVGDATAALVLFSGKAPEIPTNLDAHQLFQLFPYRNEVCTVELTRDQLRSVVETVIRRKWKKMQLTAAGFTMTLNGKNKLTHFSAPDRVVLAASDYVMTSLARDLPFVRAKCRRTGIGEREALEKFLAL